MPNEKPIVGLAGGVGAGKSTVAGLLREMGCLVISSDALNQDVLARDDVVGRLRAWWGAEAAPGGVADRRWIAERVFDDESERQRLEALTHPLIAAERARMIARAKKDSSVKAIILDSPLLFESNLDKSCDHVLFVDAVKAERERRVATHRAWVADELQRREAAQWPLDEKRRRSDFLVRNDSDMAELRRRVAGVLREILGA